MRAPIGYVAADVEDLTPERLVQALAGAGYDAVDWTMEQFDPLEEPAQALERLVASARAAGLGCPQLMVHQDYVSGSERDHEQRVRRTELAIDAAAAAGIPSIGVLTGPNLWVEGYARVGVDIDEGEAWRRALVALERICARAQGTGVRVALEPCWGTLARDRFRAEHVLCRFGAEDLALTIDPSHFVMSRDDVPALVRAWAPRIAHVHLKDAFGAPGAQDEDFCFLLPGEGRVDWPGMLDALEEIGYEGAMSVEFEAFTLRRVALAGSVEAGAQLARRLVDGVLAGQAGAA